MRAGYSNSDLSVARLQSQEMIDMTVCLHVSGR